MRASPIRWLKRIVVGVILLLLLVVVACNIWIIKSTEEKVYSDLALLPEHRMALVLGTSHRSADGGPNPFFQKRIEMAATLYRIGKNRSLYPQRRQQLALL